MLTVTGNIVAISKRNDRTGGRIAVSRRGNDTMFLQFTSFGAFAKGPMSILEKGRYATLTGRLVTLPKRQSVNRTPERNTILRVESLAAHGSRRTPGGSGTGRSLHTLFGRVGQSPEIKRSISSGERAFSAANFSVAENVTYVQRDTGDVIERTEWHNVTAYGEPQQNPADRLLAGDAVLTRGRIEPDTYTALDGTRVNALRTIADKLVFGDAATRFIDLCGTARDTTCDAGLTRMNVRVSRGDRARVLIKVTVTGELPQNPEGRGVLVLGRLDPKGPEPDSGYAVTADPRNITFLDTGPDTGSGYDFSNLHAIGTLKATPDARLIETSGQSMAVADATLICGPKDDAVEMPVTIWRGAAEIVHEYAGAGDRVYVSGSLMPAGPAEDPDYSERAVASINYVRMLQTQGSQ